MNRDEKLTRARALPPARHRLDGREVLFPSEPSGGTWIGVNDSGATFALINWYSVTARPAGQPVSRGEIVRSVLSFNSRELVDASLVNFPLLRVNPFRLIGVFANHEAVVEWRWNFQRFEHIDHSWQARTWISSGFDEPGAQRSRSNTFRQALCRSSTGSADWLRRLHRSHAAGRGPYSHCMHRADAATVSYTEISVSANKASVRYIPGAPCCTIAAAITPFLHRKEFHHEANS